MIAEVLFFRLIKRCIDEYCCSPNLTLKRNRCVLPLEHAESPGENILQVELYNDHLSHQYIGATVFWKDGTTDKNKSTVAAMQTLCETLQISLDPKKFAKFRIYSCKGMPEERHGRPEDKVVHPSNGPCQSRRKTNRNLCRIHPGRPCKMLTEIET